MLKKTVTYTDGAGNLVTEDLYFNLTKAEITEMEFSVRGGLTAMMEIISHTKDEATIIAITKDIILRSFGEKYTNEKGITRFLKSQEIRDAFVSTEAYSTIFMSFIQDVEAFNDFIVGVMPLDMQEEIRKHREEEAKKKAAEEKDKTDAVDDQS